MNNSLEAQIIIPFNDSEGTYPSLYRALEDIINRVEKGAKIEIGNGCIHIRYDDFDKAVSAFRQVWKLNYPHATLKASF